MFTPILNHRCLWPSLASSRSISVGCRSGMNPQINYLRLRHHGGGSGRAMLFTLVCSCMCSLAPARCRMFTRVCGWQATMYKCQEPRLCKVTSTVAASGHTENNTWKLWHLWITIVASGRRQSHNCTAWSLSATFQGSSLHRSRSMKGKAYIDVKLDATHRSKLHEVRWMPLLHA